ncbi:hypothetical protein AB0B25_16335 [Nocardia sp. NPDC049190]|uniref:hypothetical protein n=1 Tax=Nocardia sp. NPDC049190 TaxID=3155650 RepID=UPI003400BC7E
MEILGPQQYPGCRSVPHGIGGIGIGIDPQPGKSTGIVGEDGRGTSTLLNIPSDEMVPRHVRIDNPIEHGVHIEK